MNIGRIESQIIKKEIILNYVGIHRIFGHRNFSAENGPKVHFQFSAERLLSLKTTRHRNRNLHLSQLYLIHVIKIIDQSNDPGNRLPFGGTKCVVPLGLKPRTFCI